MSGAELAAIVARDAGGPTAHTGPVKTYGLIAAADRKVLLAMLRETRNSLAWMLRYSGGECPADWPTHYRADVELLASLVALDPEPPQ